MKDVRPLRFLASVTLALLAAAAAVAPASASGRTETAVLAGGCFWGMEAVFSDLRGVRSVLPGYSGGTKETAQYETVASGRTGHAESVRIEYDPAVISYKTLLDVYFTVAHDPTERDRQGPDEGPQYRSTIFYGSEGQRRDAESTIRRLTAEHRFSAPIVTTVVPFVAFYPAEAYHRRYVALHPDMPYVVVNDLPKLRALRATFPALVKPSA